jgi:hypothetical protein
VRRILRRLWRGERRGSVSLEMGFAAAMLGTITLGLLGTTVVGWTRSGLQAAAMATARCVALGSPACASAETYAVNKAAGWVFPGIITAADVTVTAATTCNGANGSYTRVTISSSHWATKALPVPHSAATLTVTACYLSAAT